ncbi:tyrosine-protein phosphatase non-receptor type 18 [Spea bombifrons]|uniref:tyrosine-protein phosphatase non-receptor type 18 n=1 Tax=Spea bombifrons TaxID=233779 RepID=UPI002349FAE9|nr:tyrosine-protein phosphatase non-receptor type 18 [Spea bombifrons]
MAAESLRGFLTQMECTQRKGCEDALGKEFQDIKAKSAAFKQNNNYSTETGERQENQKKNRYKDILPYDETRVPVKLLAEEVGSDYINASFIQGLDSKPRYIATQGPLNHTVLDFWRMIWQYNVKVIVMACREMEHGKKKCERYWPLDEGHIQFGPFTISMIEKILVNVEVVLRRFRVMFQEDMREISHFQYVAWPDRGIPDSCSCFLEMIQLVRQHHAEDSAPICVHCSAGCGRTGVICTVEYIQNMVHKQRVPSDFSIYEIVLEMRRQRPSAVQTKEQYSFLYHAVTEMFEKQLLVNHNYENLSKNNTPFYDDAISFPPGARTLTRSRKEVGQRFSLPSGNVSLCGPDQFARSNPNMSETYAVVRKNKPAASATSSAPRTPPSTLEAKYDNVTKYMVPSTPTEPVYSTVAPKPNRASVSPNAVPISSSYSLAGMPSPPEVTTVEYAKVTMPRTVDTHSYVNALQSDWWQTPLSGFPAPPGRSVGMITRDDYEDVNQPLAVSGGIGFNCRIAKPKGPREPPAEWSR